MNSVIMTAYNGERYIGEQISTILNCLNFEDELIVSDDGSTDSTVEIIKEFANNDGRLKFLEGPHKGLNENIKFLLTKVSGDIIFVSDQDDIWNPNKVKVIDEFFNTHPKVKVVHHNANIVDGFGKLKTDKTLFDLLKQPKSLIGFFLRARGFGSMIAFRKEFLKYDFVPPRKIGCYDNGLMMYALRLKQLMYIDDCLMKYRRHDKNASSFKKHHLVRIIIMRMHFLRFCFSNVFRLKEKVK